MVFILKHEGGGSKFRSVSLTIALCKTIFERLIQRRLELLTEQSEWVPEGRSFLDCVRTVVCDLLQGLDLVRAPRLLGLI